MSSEEKPTAAFILSLIAGVLILIGGIVTLIVTPFFVMTSSSGPWGQYGFPMMRPWRIGGLGIALSVVGVIFGAIVIYSALILNSKPRNHITCGTLILVFSILSFIGAWAGFGVGLILGVIGGALAISWRPHPLTPPAASQLTGKFCAQCGQAMSKDAKFCPYCGKEAPA